MRIFCTPTLLFLLLPCLAAGAANDAWLTVHTDPTGAEVWLNDKYLGDSPVEQRALLPGNYTLRLVDPVQHATVTEAVYLKAGETTVIEKTITGRFGALRINTTPPGARVRIASELGTTPVNNDFMTPGKYRLELTHPAGIFEPIVEDITVERGATADLNKTLVRTNPFDRKALVRLALGAGAGASLIWAIFEEGKHRHFETLSQEVNDSKRLTNQDSADKHAIKRTLGIVLGVVCITGFEIVAFF